MMDEISAVTIEKIRVTILDVVSRDLLGATVDVSLHTSFIRDDIAFRVHGFIWGQYLDKHSVQYPTDWWQAFKERWYPKWLLAKYPVRYKVFEVDVKALYPDLKYDIPGHKARIVSQANQYITLKRWDD